MNATHVRATNSPRTLWFSTAVLLLFFGLMAFFQGGASAAVFSVNNVGDAVDLLPGDGFCMTSAGLCTLRAAIMEANALPGPDVIVLSTGIYNLSIVGVGEDSAATGDLDITDSLTILGTGMSFTVIDGLALDRVFHIAPTPADFEVFIEDLTIRGGNDSPGGGIYNAARLTLDNVSVLDNYQGGIYNEGPALTLVDSEVRLNSNGAGIMSFSPLPPSLLVTLTNTNVEDNQYSGIDCRGTELTVQGGAISGNGFGGVWGNGCEMSFDNVEILNNSTPGDGGGIMSANYAPVVNSGVIRGNQAAGKGGGIYYWGMVGRELQMTGVLVEFNEASAGGGLYVDAATATLNGVTLRENQALEDGGGIYVGEDNDATLNALSGTIIDHNISDSDADNSGIGGGIFNKGSVNLEQTYVWFNEGVGIYNEGVSLTALESQVVNNTGFAGIYTFIPSPPLLPVTLTATEVSGNEGFGYYGINGDLEFNLGAIRNNGKSGVFAMTSLTMTKATVSGNASSTEGGGLYLANILSATIEDSTISDNTANGDGGGIYYWGLTGGELSLTNVTLSANAADGNGGAIIVNSPSANTLNLTNVTISGSRADADGDGSGEGEVIYNNGTVMSVNTILDGDGSGPNCAGNLAGIVSLGHNLSSDASCPLGAVSDQPTTNPLLGPLQDNGGPYGINKTHALLPGSPAIDAGDDTFCPPTDQRGEPRPQGAACDIGAHENPPVDVCAVQTEIPESECRALEDLYNSTDGDNWTTNLNWLTSTAPCSWFGVTCAGGHVFVIELENNGLNGVIPPSMGGLVEMDTLILHENQLGGSIPPELGNLTNLRQLGAFGNQLSGSIPASLGNLTNLERLQLGFNQLSGLIPPELGNLTNLIILGVSRNQLSGSIPPSLGNLTNLEQLILSLNELSGPIPPELGSMPSLTYLVLMGNQLSGSIPPELGDLAKLNYLNLMSNQLSGSIPSELGDLTNLIQLGLESNQLSGGIPSSLGNLSDLELLQLADNQLSGTIPSNFGNLGAVEELTLNNNPGLTGPLPTTLTSLLSLNTFRFHNTDLCEPPEASFQTWLAGIPEVVSTDVTCAVDVCAVQTELPESECRALEDLYNNADGDNWTNNTDWLISDTPCSWFGVTCSSGHVTSLDLHSNQLNGPIPASLANLSMLSELHLWNNQLNGVIPSELGSLSHIDILTLAGNQLTGSIPPELGNLTQMTGYLNLDNNALTGLIPPELGNLTNLTSLGLFNNQLSGPIPAELGNLTNLLGLYLSGNQLSGTLPDELGNLVLLRNLWLHDNPDLMGMLPLTLADLLFMETFYFDNTDLCEPPHPWFQTWLNGTYDVHSTDVTCDIPFCSMVTQISQQECEALVALYASTDGDNWNYNDGWMDRIEPCTWIGLYCQAGHVIHLDLQGRGLNGPLPSEIGQLEYLELLNLRDNQLQGTIPPGIGGLSQLDVLDLSKNQFTGSIPDALGNLGNLRNLALSDNQLTGSLPASLGQLTNLEYLILYDNQLFGAIPPELGSLSVLVRLDLENNQFTGTLPPELGNLVNLIYLYLGNNQISGVIPAEFGNMAELEFLRLWSNQLTGPLPPELGNLPNLISLYLPDNQLTGALPAAWENFASIREILVFNNPLSGPVPMSYINLSTLNIFEFQNTNICEPPEPVFQDWLNNLSYVSSTDVICPNTGAGTDVEVTPIDYGSGTTPVTLTFANVLWEGYTSLEITDSGPEPPDGFMLGDPPTYYELETTAAHIGVEICIDYSGISYTDESTLALYHYEEGEWVNVTTFHDMVNDIICGESLVLSPFAVFEEMNRPPSADANGPYVADEGSLVSFDGTGSSDPDGDELVYDWDFGDGEVGSGATPTHAYGDDGEFAVTLVVSDPGGLSDSSATTATISNVAPSVDAGDDATIFSGEVLFIEAGFVDPGRLDTHTATIDFGAGEGPETATVAQGTGSGTVKGSHRYLPPGDYNVEVCVTDDDGDVGCDAFNLEVLPLPVEIDVRPDGDTNAVNCKSEKSVLTVAILTTQDFDATTVDHTAVTFDGASETHVDKKRGEPRRHEEDVDGDGDLDLVFHFRFGDTDLTCDSVEGRLKGETFEGIAIEGVDSVRMVGDKDS